MASASCRSCLLQLRPAPRALTLPLSMAKTAPFHTAAVLQANPMQKKKNKDVVQKFRVASAFKMKKKKHQDRVRPPPIGERQALRRRIVLSNPNALEVLGMKDLSLETMNDSRFHGSVLGLPMAMLDQLRAAGAFKAKQGWGIFRRPGMVMRYDALEMGKIIQDISSEGASKGKTFKRIIDGVRGSGKTAFLTQAMAMAFLKEWVVITVPEAQDLVIGRTNYAPLPGTNPVRYTQNDETAALLSRIVAANDKVMSKLHVSREHPSLASSTRLGMTLKELANLGIQDRAIAWGVFQALWAELTAVSPAPGGEHHFSQRPPMLITVDGLSHWMKDTEYRTPKFECIHAHDLALVNHFLSILKPGAELSSLPNGGIALYALSSSNKPAVYALDVALKQLEACQAGIDQMSPNFPQLDLYRRPDMRVIDAISFAKPTDTKEGALELQILTGLSREETQGYLEHFARSGILREEVNIGLANEKWTLASGGIVGELEKLGKRVRVMAPIPSAT